MKHTNLFFGAAIILLLLMGCTSNKLTDYSIDVSNASSVWYCGGSQGEKTIFLDDEDLESFKDSCCKAGVSRRVYDEVPAWYKKDMFTINRKTGSGSETVLGYIMFDDENKDVYYVPDDSKSSKFFCLELGGFSVYKRLQGYK